MEHRMQNKKVEFEKERNKSIENNIKILGKRVFEYKREIDELEDSENDYYQDRLRIQQCVNTLIDRIGIIKYSENSKDIREKEREWEGNNNNLENDYIKTLQLFNQNMREKESNIIEISFPENVETVENTVSYEDIMTDSTN